MEGGYVRYVIWTDDGFIDLEDRIFKIYKSRKHAIRYLKKHNKSTKIKIQEAKDDVIGDTSNWISSHDYRCTRIIFKKPPKKLYLMTIEQSGDRSTSTEYYLYQRWKYVIEICKDELELANEYMEGDSVSKTDLDDNGILYKEKDLVASINKYQQATIYNHEIEVSLIKTK